MPLTPFMRLTCALIALACAASSAPVPRAEAQTGAQADDDISPALFVIRDEDSTLYLYGSIHALYPGAPWSNARVRAAILEADEVWTESDTSEESAIREGAAFAASLADPSARPLSARLARAEAAQLNSAAKAFGLDRAWLDTLDPWEVALLFMHLRVQAAGRDYDSGVDRQVVALAQEHVKPLRWLEDMGVAAFAALPERTQIEFMLGVTEDYDSVAEQVDALEDMWRRGDLAAIDAEEVTPMREDYPALYAWIAAARNAAWMEVLRTEMAGAGIDFVVVGTAHLIGPDSLVALFESEGFVVERVEIEPPPLTPVE